MRNLLRNHWTKAGVAAAVLIISGYLHGVETNRWGATDDLPRAVQALEQVPATIGDWTSEPVPMPAAQLEVAEVAGHFSRHYVNRTDGTAVNVLIVCGRPGPIAVHPPTVCFTGGGYQVAELRTTDVRAADTVLGQFHCADFVKDAGGIPLRIRTWWGWSTDGSWQAPDQPRRTFAGQPALYKMYVTRQLRSESEPLEDDPAESFLRQFLPKVREQLATSSAP